MIKIRCRAIAEYVFMLAIILNCNTIWNVLNITYGWFPEFTVILLYLAFIVCLVLTKINVKRVSRFLMIYTGIVLLCGLLYILGENSSFVQSVKILMGLLPIGLYISNCDENLLRNFMIRYRDIIFAIALVSLFLWLFGSVLKWISPTGVYISLWGGAEQKLYATSYFGIYWETQSIVFFGKYHMRNGAIFTEAPMTAYCFNLAFMLDTLFIRDHKHFRTIMLGLAIISTFSTMGYLVLMLDCLYLFFLKHPNNKLNHCIKVLGIPALLSAAVIAALLLYHEKLGTVSGESRIEHYIAGLQAWILHPIFGDGIGGVESMSNSLGNKVNGFNNAVTQIMVQGGVLLLAVYLMTFINALLKSVRKDKYFCGFTLLLLFQMFFVAVPYTFVTLMMLCLLARYGMLLKSHRMYDGMIMMSMRGE